MTLTCVLRWRCNDWRAPPADRSTQRSVQARAEAEAKRKLAEDTLKTKLEAIDVPPHSTARYETCQQPLAPQRVERVWKAATQHFSLRRSCRLTRLGGAMLVQATYTDKAVPDTPTPTDSLDDFEASVPLNAFPHCRRKSAAPFLQCH